MLRFRLLCAGLLALCADAQEPPLLGSSDFLPSPEHPVGFRGDWTGRYPGAEPPLSWSATENVRWKTTVGVGESSPIVVGGRIFILTDGICLRCLNREDGKVLWERRAHVGPEDAELRRLEEWIVLYHRLRPLREKRQELERRASAPAGRAGTPVAPAPADLTRQLAQLGDEIAPLKAELEGPLGEVARFDRIENRSKQFPRNPEPHIRGDPFIHAIATPCSDGRAVYAWLPTGVVAVYDLDGKPLWRRVLGQCRASGGWYGGQVAPSPLLADGKLIIHYDKIYCLEAATGKTLWEAPQKLLPIPSPVAAEKNGHWYVALGSGQILRLSDGQYIEGGEDSIGHDHVGVGSPIAYDGVFCWMSHALALPDDPDGAPRLLWEVDKETCDKLTRSGHNVTVRDGKAHVRGMGWHGYGSPVREGGVVYYHAERNAYSAVEAHSGKWLYTHELEAKRLRARCGGAIYPSLTVAGPYVFATGSGGVTMAIQAGRGGELNVAGECRLVDLGGNMLVFHGRRLFVHGGDCLYCIGGR